MDTKNFLARAAMIGAFGGFVWATAPAAITNLSMSAEERAANEASVYWSNCADARAANAAPIRSGQPGYRDGLDGDGDGIACEPPRY